MDKLKRSVGDFYSSLNFLTESIIETFSFISSDQVLYNKPKWVVQTEKFQSFLLKIKDDDSVKENLKKKIVLPVYQDYSVSFLGKLIEDSGKVNDEFLKISKEEEPEFKINPNPNGLHFKISNLFLPVSEAYTEAVKSSIEKKKQNPPYPIEILLGLYTTFYYSINEEADFETQKPIFEENVKVLMESLESYDTSRKPQAMEGGPMVMIKNMLGNIDMNQIGEMMKKVSGDQESNKEFGEVFGKITDVIKSGGNPLEAMGDIIKEATVHAAEKETIEEKPESETMTVDLDAGEQE